MKKITLFLAAVLCFQTSNASHIAAAEIWYEHDTLNDYTIHLKIYSDCQGVAAGPNQIITVSGGANYSLTLNLDTNYNLYSCLPNNCQNPSNGLKGYEVLYYSADTTIPPANNWKFLYTNCCRNPNQTGPNANISVYATLDNTITPFNNAPSSPYDVSPYYFVNNTQSVDFGTIETDGDSLDHRLTTALNNGIPYALTAYNAPLTPQNPITTTPAIPASFNMNSSTGELSFTPTAMGQYIVAIETREYRNGVQISSLIRDYSVNVLGTASPNALPNLSGINNTTATTATIAICPTTTMNFTVNSSDADVTDSTQITALSLPSGSSFSTNTNQNQIGTFNWTPSQADVQAQPHFLVLEVKDNNCGVRHKIFQLYVNNCNTDSVWAGDTDVDFTCDAYDVLNIGIANGATGPVRVGATTTWQAEWCANWTNNFINSMNYKHADCNGDGTVNSADLVSITNNYGSVHNKNSQIGQYKTLGLPDLQADATGVNAVKGTTVAIPVSLGDIASPMNDIYGISATVELLNAQTSAPINITYNSSWLGNSVDSWLFERNLQPNKSAFTIVRNIQQSTNGYGQIATINFPIDAASVVGSQVVIQFSDIKIIKKTGEEIIDYNVVHDTVTITAPNSVSEFDNSNTIQVYPNPTKSKTTINIKTDKAQEYKIALFDVVGKLIDANVFNGSLNAGEHTLELDLSGKAQGEYLLEIQTELGKKVVPIQKW